MRDLHARADATLRAAYEAGVPIYAGTDAGGVLPHGLIGREVLALHEQVGMLARSTRWLRRPGAAREWLGRPGLGRGGVRPTSCVYDADPRADLRVLAAPARPSSCAAASSPDRSAAGWARTGLA